VIDGLSKATGHGEITITNFMRAQDFNSYHSKAQAADISVKRKRKNWFEAMVLFKHVLLRLDWQCQFDLHLKQYNMANQHIHLEIDNGELSK